MTSVVSRHCFKTPLQNNHHPQLLLYADASDFFVISSILFIMNPIRYTLLTSRQVPFQQLSCDRQLKSLSPSKDWSILHNLKSSSIYSLSHGELLKVPFNLPFWNALISWRRRWLDFIITSFSPGSEAGIWSYPIHQSTNAC